MKGSIGPYVSPAAGRADVSGVHELLFSAIAATASVPRPVLLAALRPLKRERDLIAFAVCFGTGRPPHPPLTHSHRGSLDRVVFPVCVSVAGE